jgi:CheY-like chemotaxis protein
MTPRPGKALHTPVAETHPPGGEVINILLLEDNARDAELIRHALEKGDISFRLVCVDSRAAFIHQLIKSPPDLILSDYSMPSFDPTPRLSSSPARSAKNWPLTR